MLVVCVFFIFCFLAGVRAGKQAGDKAQGDTYARTRTYGRMRVGLGLGLGLNFNAYTETDDGGVSVLVIAKIKL